MVSGLAWRGFAGRAPIVRDQRLSLGRCRRIEVGPFESFEVPPQKSVRSAGIVEVDRDPSEGWVWMSQTRPLPEEMALTLWVQVQRPGSASERARLVLVCEGE